MLWCLGSGGGGLVAYSIMDCHGMGGEVVVGCGLGCLLYSEGEHGYAWEVVVGVGVLSYGLIYV